MRNLKCRNRQNIQQSIFKALTFLITTITIILALISAFINIRTERNNIDRNLMNVALTVSGMQQIQNKTDDRTVYNYLNSIKETMPDIDIISIIGADGIRKYHTNNSLIGTKYDGTIPVFYQGKKVYAANDVGVSGSQRRAYAGIYDENGEYVGFVLAVMLNDNIYKVVFNTIAVHIIISFIIIIVAFVLSKYISKNIRNELYGYEPDIFSKMFNIRDEILESLDEGIVAVGSDDSIVYMNKSAQNMLKVAELRSENKASIVLPFLKIKATLNTEKKVVGVPIHFSNSKDILADKIPVIKDAAVTGVLCILRDRTEYTKMMEDLSGVKYMVECMRANNHDFTNKLHVILGLIEMGNYSEACEYISNITSVQQATIHNIMASIDDPSVAALLIGKYSRAAELNIKFMLDTNSKFTKNDVSFSSGDLVTIIGNLIENAMDSINEKADLLKEISIGIFTKPHALIIQIDDTGMGIEKCNKDKIFENGYTTKGESHGTGLYIVKSLVNKYNGTIEVTSEYGIGTSFTVTLTDEENGE